MIFILLPIWGWFTFEALTEQSYAMRAIYAPYVKRGLLGRLAARILCPGWATGVMFTTALAVGLALAVIAAMAHDAKAPAGSLAKGTLLAALGISGYTPETFPWLLWSMALFTVLAPVLLVQAFPRTIYRMVIYLLGQLGFLFFFGVASMADLTDYPLSIKLLGLFPGSALLTLVTSGFNNEKNQEAVTGSFIVSAVVITVLLGWRVWREFQRISECERELLLPDEA